ncbi:matrixin family metalloprotease [Paenibacillus sp. LHD-38]|uniref:matrixin family metalloprotease n=1 Tax=Paenibacillus sp. LHD-38 TaxID=3072143 RepID=UPI00280D8806|nr:matrixin family metalloprotease [Paenibacillus sp. LHD-38]MDQ8736881.1 matrixin family metalloprotease [Paenibacillus sp. LHD-38]
MKKRSTKNLLVTLFGIIGLMLGASSAFAYDVWFYGGFTPYPTTVYPYSTFDATSKTAMINASAQWNNAGIGNMVSIGSNTSNTTYPNDNNLNQVTKGSRGTQTYLMQTYATTTTTIMNGKFVENAMSEADIDVNISHPWGNGSANLYDIGQVFTHELGHLLGLNHSNVTGATMISGSSVGETYKRDIEQDDKDGISVIY